jgi:hypothetical protein
MIARPVFAAIALAATQAISLPGASSAAPITPSASVTRRTFEEVSIRELRRQPERYAGAIFDEEFVFNRIWWGDDRKRPGQPSLDLPTHFTARVVASPSYVARIEFPLQADPIFEPMRDGTKVRLRVRFLRLHPANRSPVFAFEELLPRASPGTDLDYLQR